MTAPTRSIIALDLDGTLIDCEQRQVQLMAHALRSSASTLAVDAHQFWALKRSGANNVAALRSLSHDERSISAATQVWNDLIETPEWLQRDAVLPGVLEGLAQLADLGYERHLLSARQQPQYAQQQLQQLGLHGLLDAVCFVSPARASVAKAAYLKTHPCALFMGDSESDFAAAQLSSTPFIAVSSGQRSADYLAQSGMTTVCASFAEALNVFFGSDSFARSSEGRGR